MINQTINWQRFFVRHTKKTKFSYYADVIRKFRTVKD